LSFLGDWNRVLGLPELCSDSRWYVLQTERMRAGLEEARCRHVRALLSAAERAAAGRLRAAEAALELARCRNATLSESLTQISAEGQAWIGVAKSHEAVVAGLRATLDQLLQSSCAAAAEGASGEGDAEDARSCCFETPPGGNAGDDGEAASVKSRAACKACGEGESCVLLLPCRHLCLCPACDATTDTCPVCAAAKNASLHVLLS
jgi:E3 ubiquitin-protein ligase BOI-like protein